MFGIYFAAAVPDRYADVIACDIERFKRFFHAMLERGVYLAPSAYEAGFVSMAHDDAVIDATIATAEASFCGRSANRTIQRGSKDGNLIVNC